MSDVRQLWHDRRGFSIAAIVLSVILGVALIGSLVGDDEPATVRTGATTSLPLPLAAVPATTAAPATTVATTTTTVVVQTTAAPTTTPPTTAAPVTTRAPVITSPPATTATTAGASAYYANCTDARAAGAAPLRRGDPGYRSGLDRDNDGVACE